MSDLTFVDFVVFDLPFNTSHFALPVCSAITTSKINVWENVPILLYYLFNVLEAVMLMLCFEEKLQV